MRKLFLVNFLLLLILLSSSFAYAGEINLPQISSKAIEKDSSPLRISLNVFSVGYYYLNITISPTSTGTVDKTTPYWGENAYLLDTLVALTAIPGTGYIFVNWTGDLISSANPADVTMNTDKNITANFKIVQCSKKKPLISKIAPANGSSGITVEIKGRFFCSGGGMVLFGTVEAEIIEWSNTSITVVVPDIVVKKQFKTVLVKVKNANNKVSNTKPFKVLKGPVLFK